MVGHSAMDGVAIGAAFQVGGGMGAAVAMAVIAHDFADGFNTYTLTSLYGNARRRAIAMLVADAVAPVAGAASTLLFSIRRASSARISASSAARCSTSPPPRSFPRPTTSTRPLDAAVHGGGRGVHLAGGRRGGVTGAGSQFAARPPSRRAGAISVER